MAKRSLILAGGGLKVAFQAGVLQVWLDEAGLRFDHVDGASGGVFNLAMYCQGMSGTRIADNWRRTPLLEGIQLNLPRLDTIGVAPSLFTLDGYRRSVFPAWGLDWRAISQSRVEATFNVYNFSKHELEVLGPSRMNEDFLCACVSLPMWFPPVKIDGQIYIDSVFITDANIEEAIRRGASEIWVIWTVSRKSEWNDGFIANYFQIIETSANGHFKRICRRIEENNQQISGGASGEFGRHIDLKILAAEVPLHYLVNLEADRLAEAVNLGVQQARRWCGQHGIPLLPESKPVIASSPVTKSPREQPPPVTKSPREQPPPVAKSPREQPPPLAKSPREQPPPLAKSPREQPTPVAKSPREQPTPVAKSPREQRTPISVEFTEQMKGFLALGERDYGEGYEKGRLVGLSAAVRMTISIADLDRFVTDPQHQAKVGGHIDCAAFGGRRPVSEGVFNMLVDLAEPSRKAMYYRLFFTNAQREPLTFVGFKNIQDDPGADQWDDTTTLFTRVLRQHVSVNKDGTAPLEAGGILRIQLADFIHQMSTFRVEGAPVAARIPALARFGSMFFGKLWDVYGQRNL
jgi:predicted patatin/cPLA2 family phospholipase